MGVLFLLVVLLAPVAGQVGARHPVPPQPAEDVVAAGTALLQRVLPSTHAGQFVVEAIPCDAATGREALEYEAATATATATSTTKVTLRGCTGVAVASALHWYLKEEVSSGYSALSWASLPPVQGLPTTLPVPKAKRRLVRPVRFSWYTNVCTPSYSFAWWDWARWEQEIDLMAMHGVNIMYAHTGAEHVQAKVWTDLLGANATRGIDDFYTGPAFLAWFRMGNLKKWGGPMPQSFLEQQHALQLHILPRLQSLGIIGVLPAFAGFVPDALRYAFPNASITRGAQWMTGTSAVDPSVTGEQISGPDILDAQDPLFKTIGNAFLSGYRQAYAVANYSLQHYYSADTFNENTPPSSDPGFLKNYSTATYNAMAVADSDSVWVTQAWAFGASYWTNDRLEAYLSGVSNSSMLMLDLVSDQMPLWDGQWPALHNLMPAKCCKTNASASCADCDGEGDEHCCDPAVGTGGWTGLAKTHNYKNYFGKDWIYCALNNYGGNNGVFGLLATELKAPAAAHAKVAAQGLDNMVGVGLTMEGIDTNWIINDALLEQAWQFTTESVEEWVTSWVGRRYGVQGNAALQQAWAILTNQSETSVYNGPRGRYFASWGNTRSMAGRRPFWASGTGDEFYPGASTSPGFMGSAPRYNPKQLNTALALLLQAAEAEPSLKQQRNLRVDVMDLAQSMMGNAYVVQLDALNATLPPAPATPPAPPAPGPHGAPQMCHDRNGSSCTACTSYIDKRCPGPWCGACVQLSSPCSKCWGTCVPANWWETYKSTASPEITCTGNATGCNQTCNDNSAGQNPATNTAAFTPLYPASDNTVKPSPAAVQAAGDALLAGVTASDELFASDEHYLLGKWIAAAKAMGANDDEKKLLEFNARTQVTLWGPPLFTTKNGVLEPGSPQDYAGKAWGGLYKDFYLPRQRLLIECAVAAAHRALAQGSSGIDMDAFAANFTNLTLHHETAWGAATTGDFATEAVGDMFEIAGRLLKLYGGLVDSKTWCEVRNAGDKSYRSDKAGVTNSFVLQEVLPWFEAAWEKEGPTYALVVQCV